MTRRADVEIALAQARALRDAGRSYRQIRRALALTRGQGAWLKKRLIRERRLAGQLQRQLDAAPAAALPVRRSGLPPQLRARLIGAGYQTLGDIADAIADPDRPGPAAVGGIGPVALARIAALLASVGLGTAAGGDLQASVEALFPEMRD
jgi:hypothetical protein